MKQLVLTKIDKSSIKKKSNLFFLGNWCYDSVDEYKKLQTNDYHWDDKIKRNKDYAYLKLLYENVLNELSEQLELYHNTKKNKRYWRIILGPWLFSFIFSIFDRFEIIKKISNEKTKDPYTKKFSDGHKIGLLYSPKKIKGGVNLENSKKLIVPYNSSAIFSGRLIHGSGENNDTIIRFSLDFRIIPKKDWNEYKSLDKSSHFSSGKSYFIEFSETQ